MGWLPRYKETTKHRNILEIHFMMSSRINKGLGRWSLGPLSAERAWAWDLAQCPNAPRVPMCLGMDSSSRDQKPWVPRGREVQRAKKSSNSTQDPPHKGISRCIAPDSEPYGLHGAYGSPRGPHGPHGILWAPRASMGGQGILRGDHGATAYHVIRFPLISYT